MKTTTRAYLINMFAEYFKNSKNITREEIYESVKECDPEILHEYFKFRKTTRFTVSSFRAMIKNVKIHMKIINKINDKEVKQNIVHFEKITDEEENLCYILTEINDYTDEESFLDDNTISQLKYKKDETFDYLFYNTEEEIREILTKNNYVNIDIDTISYRSLRIRGL